MKNLPLQIIRQTADDTLTTTLTIGTALFATITLFTIYFIIKYSQAQQRLWKKEVDAKAEQINLEQNIRKDINEHLRRELHDSLGATLALLNMQLKAQSAKSNEEEKASLQKSVLLTEELMKEVKQLASRIQQNSLFEFNLNNSLHKLAQSFNETQTIWIEVNIEANLHPLPAPTCLHIFRVCQELINNTIQHAKATHAKLSLNIINQILYLNYSDNGIGFQNQNPNKVGRNGLQTLEERIKLMQGKLSMNTINGFIFEAQIPLS